MLIGIGGAHSGCGKTRLACILLEASKGWGAIKCTPSGLYATISSDRQVLMQAGKDTALMLGAGALDVRWVQAPKDVLSEALDIAIADLSHLDAVIVEGNSAIEVLNPDIVIFILGKPGLAKQGASAVLDMADAVVAGDCSDNAIPTGKRCFAEDDTDGIAGFVREAFFERKNKGRN